MRSGGLERAASNFANASEDSANVTIISLSSEDSFYELNKNVDFVSCPKNITQKNRIFRFIFTILWLRRLVVTKKIHIVCAFGERYNPIVFSIKGIVDKIFVLNRASPLSSLKGVRGFINPILYKLSDGFILQTSKSFELLKKRYGLTPSNVLILGNPIDLNYPDLTRKKVILNVGSFMGLKNQDLLIKYFTKMSIYDWQLHFVGDGYNIQKCMELSRKNELNKQIIFHGLVKNTRKIYSQSEIFAFTSTSEGFPNALAEAMAAGCACIAYDCVAGPSDIIDDGINGFLIPVGNEALYKKKLQLLIDDSELRQRFSIAAKEKMKQFDLDIIATKFYDFITQGFENNY